MSDEYNFNYKKRGQAISIVNRSFGKNSDYDEREGANKDLKKMLDLFLSLDFWVVPYWNLTADEMMQKILKARNNKDVNVKSDCFALVISSHGVYQMVNEGDQTAEKVFKHAIIGADSKPLYTDDVLKWFEDTTNNETGLNGKPKLFFIQACRSREMNVMEDDNGKREGYDGGQILNVAVSAPKSAKPLPAKSIATHTGASMVPLVNDSQSTWQTSSTEDQAVSSVKSRELELKAEGKGSKYQIVLPSGRAVTFGNVKDIYEGWTIDTDSIDIDALPFEGQPGENRPSVTSVEKPVSEIEIIVPPDVCPTDCLIVYASLPNMVAFRYTDHGSVMIHALHNNMACLILEQDNILQYLTKVASDIARPAMLFDSKACISVVHRLSKNVSFKPKEADTWMDKVRDAMMYFKTHVKSTIQIFT